MNVHDINAYLERSGEIIGERSPAEIDYDNCIVAHLNAGMDIRKAIRAANRDHPAEALEPAAGDWEDVAAHYEYLKEHKAILEKLGMKE
jgi:hypothetical protein